MKPLATGLLTLSTLLLAGPHAAAYCLGRTCNPAEQICETDDDDCIVTGAPLHWASDCVTFDVHVGGSAKSNLDAETVEGAVERAFKPWLNADCGTGTPSLQVGTFGLVACNQSRFNAKGKNANIVMFRDGAWPYPGEGDTYGMTILRYDQATGRLWDADIEINTAVYKVSVDGTEGTVDLQAILTHEIGHFLGLGHPGPGHEAATMRADWNGEGTSLRTLDSDDEAGLCELYPPERSAAKSCEPVNGFSGDCFVPVDSPSARSCASAARPAGSSAGALMSALVVTLACLRRRSRGRIQS